VHRNLIIRRFAISADGFDRPPGGGGIGSGSGGPVPRPSGNPSPITPSTGVRPSGPSAPYVPGPRPSPGGGGGGGFSSPRPPPVDRGPRSRGPQQQKDGPRVNREIRAPEVRVIDDDGTMLGIFPPFEALKMAEAKGLDLIEVAPTAKPPTCKITDYGKYKYELKKKEHEARKNQTVIVIKEIQLRPRTDQHDLDVKMRSARSFLIDGDKVKVNLRFYGREMAHQELGMGLLQKVIAALSDLALVEANPKMEGKQLFVLLAPDPAKMKEYEKKQAAEAGAVAKAKPDGAAAEAKPAETKSEKKKPKLEGDKA
jgi:translation initiation factor IF-3